MVKYPYVNKNKNQVKAFNSIWQTNWPNYFFNPTLSLQQTELIEKEWQSSAGLSLNDGIQWSELGSISKNKKNRD